MAYLFGAAATDNIAVSGFVPWTTKFSVAARFSLAQVNTAQRALVYNNNNQFFFDFATSTNTVRLGWHASDGNFPLAAWTTGFTAGTTHTVIVVVDPSLSGVNRLKIYADGSATPKTWSSSGSEPSMSFGPFSTSSDTLWLGGQAGQVFSLDGTLYEVAYWPDVALLAAQAAAIGTGGSMASTFPLPTEYWPLVSDANALYGGHNGTVTGATLFTHAGGSWFPPAPPAPPPTLWFGPDLGSTDFLDIGTIATKWPLGARKTSVVKFFEENLIDYVANPPGPPGYIGTNTLPNFVAANTFRKLNAAGIKIGMETTVIAVPDGSWDTTAFAIGCIGNVAAAGGVLKYLDCDTTLGRATGQGLTQAQAVTKFKAFTDAVLAAYPNTLIGDIEPLPGFSVAQLLSWVDDCLTAGIPLKWLSLDNIWSNGASAYTDAQNLATGLASRNIPLRIIVNPGIASSVTVTDADFYTPAHATAVAIQSNAISPFTSLTVESWYTRSDLATDRSVPLNFTETTANTLSKLLLETASLYSVADVPTGGTGLLLMGVG